MSKMGASVVLLPFNLWKLLEIWLMVMLFKLRCSVQFILKRDINSSYVPKCGL